MKKKKTIYDPQYEFIINQLKIARKQSGLRQQTISDEIGKYESYLSKIENGDRRIDILELVELARIYKKKLEFFIPNNKPSKIKTKKNNSK